MLTISRVLHRLLKSVKSNILLLLENSTNCMIPTIFLDRDGVIIENRPNYIRSWDDVFIYPQVLDALARVNWSDYKIVIVTNQSVVGRGFISLEEAEIINRRLVNVIEEAGGRVDGVFMCPHHPDEGCACRKPKHGLFLRAAESLSLDLSASIMIGDALSDLEAGKAAGVSKLVLVRTGRGAAQSSLGRIKILGQEVIIYDTLVDALDSFVSIHDHDDNE